MRLAFAARALRRDPQFVVAERATWSYEAVWSNGDGAVDRELASRLLSSMRSKPAAVEMGEVGSLPATDLLSVMQPGLRLSTLRTSFVVASLIPPVL